MTKSLLTKKRLNKRSLLAFISLGYLLSASTTYAQPQEITIRPVAGFSSLGQAVSTIVSVVMFGGALLCFGYLMYGAIKYITAGDNAANASGARQTMLNAIIGLFLLGLVFVIFQILVNIIPGLGQFF